MTLTPEQYIVVTLVIMVVIARIGLAAWREARHWRAYDEEYDYWVRTPKK